MATLNRFYGTHEDTTPNKPLELRCSPSGLEIGVGNAWNTFTKEDGPALALMILRAIGVRGEDEVDTFLHSAAYCLESHLAKEEVADRLKLEEEAFTMFKAAPYTTLGHEKFSDLESGAQDQWLAIARKAREIHGVSK